MTVKVRDSKGIGKIARWVWCCCAVLALHCLFSCANMGAGPQGGPQDVTPPAMKKSNPAMSAVSVKPKSIDIYFDEYVEIKDGQKIVVSPPSETPAEIKAVGKRVIVEFKDTLKSNSTYIINFADNIRDFREGNPIKDFYFEFATGAEIDSFFISGYVVDAETLVPQEDVSVGVYAEFADTTFDTRPFDYVAKSDAQGHFVLRGLKSIPYRLFAVKDDNSNYHFDAPGEYLAFTEETITPQKELVVTYDTTYKVVNKDSLLGIETEDAVKDTSVIDTIKKKERWRYFPDSIELAIFQKHIPRQNFGKVSRKTEREITVIMENEKPQTPKVRLMRAMGDTIVPYEGIGDSAWCAREMSVTTDTITYWVKDTTLLKSDSITLEITYLATDTVGAFVEQTDTITALYKHSKKEKKAAEKEKKSAKKKKSELTAKITSAVGIGQMPVIEWVLPCVEFATEDVRVYVSEDTLKKDIAHTIEPIDGVRKYRLSGAWEEGKTYIAQIDSGKVGDIYGNVCDSTGLRFKMREKNEYSNFKIEIEGAEGDAYVELLDKNCVVVRKMRPTEWVVSFENLEPGEYAVRMFIDENGDGEWTSGDYAELKQPEKVYFFHKQMTLNKSWDYEEKWEVGSKLPHEQRPQGSYPKSKKR